MELPIRFSGAWEHPDADQRALSLWRRVLSHPLALSRSIPPYLTAARAGRQTTYPIDRMQAVMRAGIFAFAVVAVAGCGPTIEVSGGGFVTVVTEPEGGTCNITRAGQWVGRATPMTPGVNVTSSVGDLVAQCTHPSGATGSAIISPVNQASPLPIYSGGYVAAVGNFGTLMYGPTVRMMGYPATLVQLSGGQATPAAEPGPGRQGSAARRSVTAQ
jgi:hypothetical protein